MKYLIPFFFLVFSLSAEDTKPNVMFIFADDMTFEALSMTGRTAVKTPNLDKLAARGVHFTRAYNMGGWNGAICMASRAMLNSGAYINNAQKAIKNKPRWSELMKGAGYTTYMTGKWHVPGAPRFDVVKDVRPGMPKGSGYNRPKSVEDYNKGWKPWDKAHSGFWQGGKHWSEIIADHSIDFLKQAKADDKPFFMYLAFNAPHDPRQAPKEYVDMYPLDKIATPKNYLDLYPYKDKIGCSKGLRDEKLAPFPRTEYAVKVHRQEYYAIVTHLDDQVGKMLTALKETGKEENTYIIFTADHGLSVGHHGLVGKQNMYEHSMKVPFFIVGPGIKAGTKVEQPIYLQDAMATSLDLAGVKKPDHVEFQSLMPVIKGKKKTNVDAVFGKYVNLQRMIIKDDWKLIIYPKAKKMRLFNLQKDPEEMNDLVDNPEYVSKLIFLKSEYKKLQIKMKDGQKVID